MEVIYHYKLNGFLVPTHSDQSPPYMFIYTMGSHMTSSCSISLKGNVVYTMALTADTLLANVTNWSRTLESHSKNRKPPGFAKYAASAPPPTPPRPESKEDDPRFGEDWEEGRKD